MKRKLWILALVLVLASLAACGKDGAEILPLAEPDEILPLAVTLSVTEKVAIAEKVKMEAIVSLGEEKVEDADEVVFEVWEEGKKDDSVMIESINEKAGLYTAETTFDHDGLFHIQVHVTARSMHTMPKKEVTVGHGAQQEEEHKEDHEHGTTEGFSLHFMKPEQVKATEELKLVTHLQMDGHPLEKARVRYEIWNDANPDKRDWLDAEEKVAGEYTATQTFAEAGTFKVQIHVEDEHDLHEHEEFTVEVK
ncbi:FixH family protein [Sporosarcina limicola]|uniref:G3E family GTPase n=1 Tax=Sporosarcina limicola TaxID=34101 RepID=A0A927MGM0_9BACL|nr:FixH family protein [Sporosarcina limicola]MBE1554258.1 G3E family GTPase [Sporosarcina limicola]